MAAEPSKTPDPEQDNAMDLLEDDHWVDKLSLIGSPRSFLSKDWSECALGPVKSWTKNLRLYTVKAFANSQPCSILWGTSKATVYNQYFALLAGNAHPQLMGNPPETHFPELWNLIKRVASKMEESKVPSDLEESQISIAQNQRIEETNLTAHVDPIVADSGEIEGLYLSFEEIADQKIKDRRAATLDHLVTQNVCLDGSLGKIMASISTSQPDVPLALLYGYDTSNVSRRCPFRLLDQTTNPANPTFEIIELDLFGLSILAKFLNEAGSAIATKPFEHMFGATEWQALGEPSQLVAILPLVGRDRIIGYLLAALNPRKSFDHHYRQFLESLRRYSSSVLYRELKHIELQRSLQLRERELIESRRQLDFLARHASVGVQHLSVDGTMLWANEQYYYLTGYPQLKEQQAKFSFLEVYLEDDQARIVDSWPDIAHDKNGTSIQLRQKRNFTPPSGVPEPVTIICTFFPCLKNGVKVIISYTVEKNSIHACAQLADSHHSQDRKVVTALVQEDGQRTTIEGIVRPYILPRERVPISRPMFVRELQAKEKRYPSRGTPLRNSHIFQRAGCITHIANHGVEALNYLRTTTCWYEHDANSNPLDIIIIGRGMQIIDGKACSREIRAYHASGKIIRHVPIIAIWPTTFSHIEEPPNDNVVRFSDRFGSLVRC
ncbi:hypothetical protein BP5796_06986 [Coleophoma crateriformis]|uniref:PAS domain-containing protein n=1 Tax=Coleophoma crateriformis TaxID=565419 RepID=A0A3D8RQ89_9HELO|nr:hypothetical protein BP5796_06986 [Coleophoma crateriformis]